MRELKAVEAKEVVGGNPVFKFIGHVIVHLIVDVIFHTQPAEKHPGDHRR